MEEKNKILYLSSATDWKVLKDKLKLEYGYTDTLDSAK